MFQKRWKVIFFYMLTWQENSKGGTKLLTEEIKHILSQTSSSP